MLAKYRVATVQVELSQQESLRTRSMVSGVTNAKDHSTSGSTPPAEPVERAHGPSVQDLPRSNPTQSRALRACGT